MRRNVWSDIVSFQTRRLDNSTKYPLFASITIIWQRKNWNLLENCHKYALKLFWNVYIWHELVDLISYGQWTNLHDQSQNGPKPVTNAWIDWFLIIHHTCKYRQFCYVGNIANQCRLGLFQDSDFAGDLEDPKSISGGTLCVFGSHTCVPVSWMCKKQTAVSHSSTESDIISLDAGLRLDGIPALDLWNLIVSFLAITIQTTERRRRPVITDKSQTSQGKTNLLNYFDCVPSNVQSSHQEALLFVFEDNEAVFKMIIKGRSSTMRHVSRTHRVALDWLFDRINLDPKIKIKYIDTKNQLADIQTKGNFTRDEWNHLLCLFNISHFSSTVLWNNGGTISTRCRRRTTNSEISTNGEPYCKGAVERIIINFSKPGEEKLWKSKYLEYNCWERGGIGETRYRHRPKESFRLLSWAIYGKFFLSKLLKSAKLMLRCTSDQPDVTSWGATRESQPGFCLEETHRDWNVQSVVDEVIPRDRPGRPDMESQEVAWPQQFVIGNDEAELDLSVESRSFVNRVNDQVRKRQKNILWFGEYSWL